MLRPPSAVAKRIVRAIEQDRPRVVVGPDAHLVDLLTRVVPGRSGLLGRLTNRLEPPLPDPADPGHRVGHGR